MGIVVSLTEFTPPPRFDGVPWTQVEVDEAPAPIGPWSNIDSQPLVPLDANPALPESRDVTTTKATLDLGWYRLIFFDAAGNESEPSDSVRNAVGGGDLPPSPDQIRNASPLLRTKFPVPSSDPFGPADLRNIVYQATALVQSLTFRVIDPSLGCPAPDGYTCEAVPTALVPVAVQAIARMSERIDVTTAADFAEQMATGRRLRGFSAGPYSESYFAPGEFARRGAQQGRPAMDVDDALDQALWALATEDARDYFVWRSTGVAPPVGQAVAFDYRRQHIGYGAGSLGGWPARGGPDGY